VTTQKAKRHSLIVSAHELMCSHTFPSILPGPSTVTSSVVDTIAGRPEVPLGRQKHLQVNHSRALASARVLLARITVRDVPWPYAPHSSHSHRFPHHLRLRLLRVPFADMTHALCPARGPALPSLSVNSLNIKTVLPTPSPTDLPPGALAADVVPQLEPSQDRRRWYPPQPERPATLVSTSRRYSGVVYKWHIIR
jgi:hypothetical protein